MKQQMKQFTSISQRITSKAETAGETVCETNIKRYTKIDTGLFPLFFVFRECRDSKITTVLFLHRKKTA